MITDLGEGYYLHSDGEQSFLSNKKTLDQIFFEWRRRRVSNIINTSFAKIKKNRKPDCNCTMCQKGLCCYSVNLKSACSCITCKKQGETYV